MTPRASLCPFISRSTTRRNRSSSPSLMLPSIVASRSAPPRRPCLTPPRKPEGCPHEEGFDRPVHAVSTCRKVLLAFTRPSDPLSHGTRLVDVRLLHPPARYLLSG